MRKFLARWRHIDFILLGSTLPLVVAGLITVSSFVSDNPFFNRQIVWVAISLIVFFIASLVDWRFLRRTGVLVTFFIISVLSLLLLFTAGTLTKGAINRFDLGLFFLQPSDPIKLVLVMLLAKYFSRRHIEIAVVRHIIISGLYALILFVLVFLQPDFGGAIIIFLIWFGMVLVSGISKKHLLAVFLIGALVFGGLWTFVFRDYQKNRIMTFLNPLTDIQGAGYNAYQSTITVGSGQFFGKGVGFGTQSRLQFLPEYETDFIFAAISEEWGFVGVCLMLFIYCILFWRIIVNAMQGATNFETLFGLGFAILLMSHLVIHIGMNVGLLPVTGTTLPFVSYGGSHLVMEFLGLGILAGMRKYSRPVYRENLEKGEVIGLIE
jgi:rod shape determining protein RodA